MNVKKFVAAQARDALRKVKETLGEDAIILSNRGVPGGVEIMAVAARDMAMIVPTAVEQEPLPKPLPSRSDHRSEPRQEPALEDDYRSSVSSARAKAAMAAFQHRPQQKNPDHFAVDRALPARNRIAAADPAPAELRVNAGIPKSKSLRQLEAARAAAILGAKPLRPEDAFLKIDAAPVARTSSAPSVASSVPAQDASAAAVIPHEVLEEIRHLRKMVEQQLAGIAWGESARQQPVRAEMMRHMLDAGFSPQFSRELLEELPSEMGVTQALAWVRGAADRSLLTITPEDDIVDRGGVFALVGPTGVGKTTTTAKLAARCVLRHGPNKVALLTTDSYRIGAHEQLRIYGRILGVSVYLVKDAQELKQTLNELRHKHLVLIDTMGMSQRDRLVPEMTDMLSGADVRRLLLLSATSRGDTMDDVVRAYQGSGLMGCILTKTDEAASLAPALDVMIRHGVRLHYVSNGQRVPEDLHLPNRAYLLHRALRDLPEDSPHRLEDQEPAYVMTGSGAVLGGQRG